MLGIATTRKLRAAFVAHRDSNHATVYSLPWQRSDAVIALAVLLPWLVMNNLGIAFVQRMWLHVGIPVYCVAFLAYFVATQRRHGLGSAGLIASLLIAPWLAFYFAGSVILRTHSGWWGLYVFQLSSMLLLPWWTVKQRSREQPRRPSTIRDTFVELAIALPALGVLLTGIAASNAVWRLLLDGSGVRWATWLDGTKVGGVWAMATLMVLSFTIVPVAEELFFRGYVYNALRHRFSKIAAIASQAFFFAVVHSHGMLALAIFGGLLGVLYEWRKSLIAPILIHAGHNLVLALFFSVQLFAWYTTPIFGIHGDDRDNTIRVTHVRADATADLAGIRAGDVVVSFDGVAVGNMDILHGHVKSKRVGQHVPVVIDRDGKRLRLNVVMHNRFHRVSH